MSDYVEVNRAMWDERADVHAASPDYAFAKYVNDPSLLSHVVGFDVPRLGSIAGLRGVHLQCHIGTDTLSLARLGARMTGLDFSPPALAQARLLAEQTHTELDFVEARVYDALTVLPEHAFDLVYTGIGALCWLPSMQRWAEVVAGLLAPGGRLFLREGHPVLWALGDPDETRRISLEFPYFERTAATVWDEPGTYVQTDHEFVHTKSMEWNHGLGDIVTALLDQGLTLTMLQEHDTVPWDAQPGLMRPVGGGEYQLIDRPERLPHTYTLQAVAPG